MKRNFSIRRFVDSSIVAVAALTAFGAYAKGALTDSADYWMRKGRVVPRNVSVLEKGYVAPESEKRSSADEDLLLGLLAAEVKTAKPARTNVVEKIVTVEKQVTNTVEVVKVQKVKVEVEKPVTNFVEKIVEKPVDRIVEKKVIVEKPVEVEKIVTVEKPVTNVVEKIVEVEKKVVVEKPVVVERTNVVEKVVYDRGMEMKLAKEKTELERRGDALEARNAGLERRNDELRRELEEERRKRERLEKAAPGAAKKDSAKTGRPARITAKDTYYDRKKGVAYFEGKVWVDDEQYQLHADKAYVFTTGTNDVRRIVAIGHVAMTNELRRAYGGKVSYYRKDGMAVLYAGDGVDAEVRDESKAEDQTVRGSKIKFWIDNEQVEVLDATISAPTEGAGLGIKGL